MLKQILARAESGEIRAAAVATVSESGTGTEWFCAADAAILSAAVADLAFRIARRRWKDSSEGEDK